MRSADNVAIRPLVSLVAALTIVVVHLMLRACYWHHCCLQNHNNAPKSHVLHLALNSLPISRQWDFLLCVPTLLEFLPADLVHLPIQHRTWPPSTWPRANPTYFPTRVRLQVWVQVGIIIRGWAHIQGRASGAGLGLGSGLHLVQAHRASWNACVLLRCRVSPSLSLV